MSDGFEAGVDIRSVSKGYEATLRRSDGTAVSSWGPTAETAGANLKQVVAGDE